MRCTERKNSLKMSGQQGAWKRSPTGYEDGEEDSESGR